MIKKWTLIAHATQKQARSMVNLKIQKFSPNAFDNTHIPTSSFREKTIEMFGNMSIKA
jgi:hypothetical protein